MKRLKLFILIGLVLIGTAGIVSAQQTLPDGGNSFNDAVEIEPGRYITGHVISADTPEYFKLTQIVKAGQLLTIKVINPAVESGAVFSNTKLYDADRAGLYSDHNNPLRNINGASKSGSLLWLPGSKESSYTYYMTIGGGGIIDTLENTECTIMIDDNFDAGSQTDAGDTFETAMDIVPGTHKGYLSGSQGTDTKDLYKLPVEAGTALNVKVTPPTDGKRGFILYNEDRIKIATENPNNPGAIVKTTQEITYSGDIYIEITPYYDDYGEYTLDLEITNETGISDGKGQDVIDYGESEDDHSAEYLEKEDKLPEEEGGLPGFEVVFTVAGLLSVAFLLKRK